MREITQHFPHSAGEAVAELVRIGREEAHFLAEWGAGEALLEAARMRALACSGDTAAAGVISPMSERSDWLCSEYKRLLQGPVEAAWSGQALALERVRCFCAAYRDLELAFLCTGRLWRNMRVGYAASARQRRAAIDEARQVLAPLLELLGMLNLRVELEEQTVLAEERPLQLDDAAKQAGAAIAAELALALHTPLPDAHVYPNKYAQIHNSPGGSRNSPKLGLLPTITVLVEDEAACYQVLNHVHKLYTPVDGGIDDTLYAPDDSGYRALNIWVVANAPTGRARISFSVAPRAQHEVNEWGAAAHLMRYRDQTPTPNAWWHRAGEAYTQIAVAPPGALPEKLYVFSPRGELFAFDRGSTVVDFAYSVHSEVAEQCRSFIVNGRPVEPATLLRHLDLVELEHDPQAPGPTRFWLAAARTARARSAIERSLKRKGQGSHHGQKIIEERLKQLERHYGFNLPAEKIEQAISDTLRKENLSRREELLAAVASGQLAADSLLHKLFEREVLRRVIVPRQIRLRHHQLFLAQCCRPRPGDEIAGRLYRRHGEVVHMTLHRRDCARIDGFDDLIPMKWRIEPTLTTLARIELRALDEVGLMGAVVQQVYSRNPRAALLRIHALARHGSAHVQLDLQADHPATVQEIVETLRRLPEFVVSEVLSLNLPPSEQEEWSDSLAGGAAGGMFNPYSRLPVHQNTMFFGRNHERARIVECLRTNQPSIWLIGQKRVGKTSLLLHLSEHELPDRGFAPVFVDFQLMDHPARVDVFFELANAVYSRLSGDIQLQSLGAPLRSLFERDPGSQLIDYLSSVQRVLGARRLVILIDEFSRLTDAYLTGQLDGAIFDRWRAMMHATMRAGIGYVVVMQQQTCDNLVQALQARPDDPSWRLMDVGLSLQLRPLLADDVRRLIEWPMRNHLEYSPDVVQQVATLSGGSPFLIQAFCHNLVLHMARQQRQQVTAEDLEAVRAEFMQPHDHTFAHMTEMLKGITNHVAGAMARLAAEEPDRQVSWDQVRAALPNVVPESLAVSLRLLVERDILLQPAPARWQFASLLFQQWLAING
jgi:GTP diphosphokinase / guanosine-3',5'-bis(diphosphate) 3'-diphosphatase